MAIVLISFEITRPFLNKSKNVSVVFNMTCMKTNPHESNPNISNITTSSHNVAKLMHKEALCIICSMIIHIECACNYV
jgi:hypothetical protein